MKRFWPKTGARRFRGLPIFWKLVLLCVLPAALMFGFFGYIALYESRATLERELSLRLISVAQAASTQVDEAELRFLEPGDETSRTYLGLLRRLNALKKATGVGRIYIFDRQLKSRVDTEPVPIGRRYYHLEVERGVIKKVLRRGSGSSLLYAANEKLYKTGYAVLYANAQSVGDAESEYAGSKDAKAAARAAAGEAGADPRSRAANKTIGDSGRRTGGLAVKRDTRRPVAVIAVEGSSRHYAVLGALTRRLVLFGGVAVFLLLALSALVARRLARPLRRLSHSAEVMGRGQLDEPIAVEGGGEVALVAASMERMRRELQRRDEQLRMMLAGIAHEVRNPLGGMELMAGMLHEDLAAEPERREQVVRIQKELDYLKRVVGDFLDYARWSLAEKRPVDLRDLVAETIELQRGAAAARQVSLRCLTFEATEVVTDQAPRLATSTATVASKSTAIPAADQAADHAVEAAPKGDDTASHSADFTVICDPEPVRRVLLNLVRNAIQAAGSSAQSETSPQEEVAVESDPSVESDPPLESDDGAKTCRWVEIRLARFDGEASAPLDGVGGQPGKSDWSQSKRTAGPKQEIAEDTGTASTAAGGAGKEAGALRASAVSPRAVREPWVRISVVDSGAGVEKELVDKIFEPFYTTKQQGTGLGLALGRKVVEAHGGRLYYARVARSVESRDRSGADKTGSLGDRADTYGSGASDVALNAGPAATAAAFVMELPQGTSDR
jgi:signal transduction histidine kinase